ncbi:MAG: histidine kinase, partial [Planctomycetes bacterium]|nr:histidine kinase [Planctomycetota bacterium]
QAEEDLKAAYKELEETNKEIKEVQSQVVQNEKLASIGQLAAGVAHEMNNPVGFVASNFETLENYVNKFKSIMDMYSDLMGQIETSGEAELKKKADDIKESRDDMKMDFILEDIQELFSDSKEGLGRITGIIQNLRDFSRIDQANDISEYGLNDGIETTLVVARNELKYNCNVKTEFSELPYIFCNSGQINQVLLNILVNAAQAIKSRERKGNGTITIRTYATETQVVCEISDDGLGIPPDKISKIFDPFFTTKPVGKGTGLGLSVSHDIIVNKHKGKILVDSTVGKGTIFTIKLPIKWENQNEEMESATNEKENSVICG